VIAERLSELRERIAMAAQRAGRRADEITLVAVSKTKPAADILAAYEAGQRHFGESYVQEFEAKSIEIGELPGAVFHFIGRLQSNKTTPAAKLFQVIQTVDSIKIARRLNETGRPLEVFLEVKISLEETKGGVAEEDLPELKEFVESCGNLRLRGLMGMPPWSDDAEPSRPYFQRLRCLGERFGLKELSMGMSHDFEVAIEEGATMIRIGTALFGKRIYSQ
jgi:pyridoxal phosphate enzyme (YggS family)